MITYDEYILELYEINLFLFHSAGETRSGSWRVLDSSVMVRPGPSLSWRPACPERRCSPSSPTMLLERIEAAQHHQHLSYLSVMRIMYGLGLSAHILGFRVQDSMYCKSCTTLNLSDASQVCNV